MTSAPNILRSSEISPIAAGAALVALVGITVLARHALFAVRPYLQARVLGAPVSFARLVGMLSRKLDPNAAIAAWLTLHREGFDVTFDAIETHLMVDGDLSHVVAALVTARRLHTPLSWSQATAIDLAGRDAIEFAKLGPAQRGRNILRFAPLRAAAALP